MNITYKLRLHFITVLTCTMISIIGVSCGNSSSGTANHSDSVHSGLEGTRDDASQLSNATVDTSSGQNVIKAPVEDSSKVPDSLPVK